MTDTSPEHPAPPPAITEIDLDPFRQPAPTRFLPLILFVPLVFGIVTWEISGRLSMNALFVAILVLALAAFAVVVQFRRRRSARIRAEIIAARPATIAAAVELARTTAGFFSTSAFSADIATAAVAAGLAGSTARISPHAVRTPVEPITFPFEPRLLSQHDAGFQSLNDANVAFASQRTAPPTAPLVQSADHRRKLLMRTAPGLILVILMVGFTVAVQFRLGGLGLGILDILLLLVPLVLVWRWFAGGLLTTRERLLVPAALIRRVRHWRRPGWQLRLFKRNESVLLAFITTHPNALSLVTVADAAGPEHFFASTWELDLFLRAWLSPLKPPKLEQLSDLT